MEKLGQRKILKWKLQAVPKKLFLFRTTQNEFTSKSKYQLIPYSLEEIDSHITRSNIQIFTQ